MRYTAQRYDVIHSFHGAYQFDVHGLRTPLGVLMLLAFRDVPLRKQADLAAQAAEDLGWPLVDLEEDAVSHDLRALFAEAFHNNPTTQCFIKSATGGEVA